MDVIHPGIPGATNRWFSNQGHARRAALQLATQLGPDHAIAHDPRPSRGLPHYHVVSPNGRRISGHFFYGRRPPRKVLRGRPWREGEGEAELERLLEAVDAAIDDAPSDDVTDEWADEWEAWDALPWGVRRWLLAVVPGWWSLPAWRFRRILLHTANLISRHGLHPRAAVLQAARHLRLPPPRRTGPRPARRPQASRARHVRARSPWRLPSRSRTVPVRRAATGSRRGGRVALGRAGGRGRGFMRR